MSCTSKVINDYITVDMIVEAALLNGGNTKTSIENIYPLIKKMYSSDIIKWIMGNTAK
jgi:hypothetical protein